jgi:2-amino-4-hydroxy-6-hydroxymethyldihydropteridine diphosphokinase
VQYQQDVLAFVGLGGNLGDPQAAVRAAIAAISGIPKVSLLAQSPLYGSSPVDAGGADYVNAVVKVRTALGCEALLDALQAIEQSAGRLRPYRNAPRTLDLDVLLFGNQVVKTDRLTVPHPRMWQREFVVRPLADIAPELVSQAQRNAVQGQGVWPL